MSYADDLAKDRDKYLAQRNSIARAMRDILPLAEAYLKNAPGDPDNAKLETARAELHKIDNAPEGLAMLRRHR